MHLTYLKKHTAFSQITFFAFFQVWTFFSIIFWFAFDFSRSCLCSITTFVAIFTSSTLRIITPVTNMTINIYHQQPTQTNLTKKNQKIERNKNRQIPEKTENKNSLPTHRNLQSFLLVHIFFVHIHSYHTTNKKHERTKKFLQLNETHGCFELCDTHKDQSKKKYLKCFQKGNFFCTY